MQNLHHLESDLWEAADQLRANSRLTATEYSMPVLGLIFLRHATNRFEAVEQEIKARLPTRGGQTRPITREDFKGRRAIYLPETARYGYVMLTRSTGSRGRPQSFHPVAGWQFRCGAKYRRRPRGYLEESGACPRCDGSGGYRLA